MQTAQSHLLAHLRLRSRDCIVLYELYRHDAPVDVLFGYNPNDAIELFAGETFTTGFVSSITYRREVIQGPTIQKHQGKQLNSVSIVFSNVSRYMSNFVLNNQVEGMRLVVRLVSRSVTPVVAGLTYPPYLILFVGKCNKPDGFDRGRGTISAYTDIGSIEARVPPRSFEVRCPLTFKGEECLGSEALSAKTTAYQQAVKCNKAFGGNCTDYTNTEFYQGTRVIQISSSFVHKSNQSFFGKLGHILTFGLLFGRSKTTVGNSIHDGTPYGEPIPIILGRWYKKLIPLQYQDVGTSIDFKMAASRGPIFDFFNIRNETPNFLQPTNIVKHKGEYGGVGAQTQDTVFPDQSFHSRLAYITGKCAGSEIIEEDPAPEISSVVAGSVILVANDIDHNGTGKLSVGTGTTSFSDWTDNPVDQARFILTDPAILNNDPDRINYLESACTAAYCTGVIRDDSNAERCLLPNTETSRAGVEYKRYYSTGLIVPDSYDILTRFQIPAGVPNLEVEYEFFDPSSPPTGLTVQSVYRKRFTSNIELTEPRKAIDFLYDTLLPSFRGFIRWDAFGRMVIDNERPADSTQLRAAAVVTNTTIQVQDVMPWKSIPGISNLLRGKVLISTHLANSEVRSVSSAAYTSAGNSITLAASASGGPTATPSGATLTGGSSSVQASGTVQLGGSFPAGSQITVTIDGVDCVLDLLAGWDALGRSAAGGVSAAINGNPIVNKYVEAHAGGSNDITITAKLGVLTLSSALAENHYVVLVDPTVAPTLASSAGSLAAGTYLVGYTYRNQNGPTLISPLKPITITASKQIDVSTVSLPSGATSIDWFISRSANSTDLGFVANNNGSAFSINSLPATDAEGIPKYNTSGAEIIRVMGSYAGKALTYADTTRANILDGTFNWPGGTRQSPINQIKGKYREAIRDFAEQPIVVNDEKHQEETRKVNTLDLDMNVIDNYNQAARLCNGYLNKYRTGDKFYSWKSAGEAILHDEGDVVCVSDDSGPFRNVPVRLEDVSIDNRLEIGLAGRIYSTNQYDDTAADRIDTPLVSGLPNFDSPPDITFNTIDFPPNGLVQSTDGTAGITSIRGGAIFGDSIYSQYATVRLIKRGGVTVNETIGVITPDTSMEAVFEFIASVDGLYTVELEVCNVRNQCNTTKPTASIIIGFGSLFGIARENGSLLLREETGILEREH